MGRIAEHSSHQSHIGKPGKPFGLAITLVKNILRFDVQAKLSGGADPFCDRGIEAVKTIEQQNLVGFKPDRFGLNAASFLEVCLLYTSDAADE